MARETFETFVHDVEPRLRRALVATYGFERGREATAEALGWAWEHWEVVESMERPTAYLFRVGQSKSRGRKAPVSFERLIDAEPLFEPGLAPALTALTERQRVAVVLIEGFEWTHREVAELLGISVSSVQSHLERGMRNLRSTLEVGDHA